MSIAEKLQTVADNQQKVYDAGYAAGQAAGGDTDAAYNEGYDAGKQAEYDAFWDAYQDNGNRTNYEGAFSGHGWNSKTFKAKYDIVPKKADKIFDHFAENDPFDLQAKLDAEGIVLDFSQNTTFINCFLWSGITRVGVIDTRAATNISSLFYCATKLKTIDKLILKSDAVQATSSNMFSYCASLEDLTVEGIFARSINFIDCTKLSYDSIISIINSLSTTTSGLSAIFSLNAVKNAFETTEGAADGSSSEEWLALVASKSNWTITLA